MMQPFEVKDFSGGITDNYLGGDPKHCQRADNLLINSNKKLFSSGGSVMRDTANYLAIFLGGTPRIGLMWDHHGQTLEMSGQSVCLANPTYSEITGPTGNKVWPFGTTVSNYAAFAFWNNQSLLVNDSFANPNKIYKDNGGTFRVRTAGLPRMAAPSVVSSAGVGNNYVYTFLYSITYNVEGVLFKDIGPTVVVALNNAGAPNVNTVNITAIPVLANGATDNYDTANILVEIYRTVNNDTVGKFVASVTNGTTIYNDVMSDATLTNQVIIYTNGGIVDNETPPQAKFVHIANDIAAYGYVKEGSTTSPNRYRLSKKGDYDSCPSAWFDDLADDLTGISSVQSTFIMLCKNSAYRIDGFFDNTGRGGPVHLRISDTIGCISHHSIVQTNAGIFFAGNEGFYFCDGYNVQKISRGIEVAYKNMITASTNPKSIYGALDKLNKRIYWACQTSSGSSDNDTIFVLDLNFGMSDAMPFTTLSGGVYQPANFAPSAIMFNSSNQLVRADKRGYVFIHDDSYLTDPKVDISIVPSAWVKSTHIYDYKSCAFDFGTSALRKFVPQVLLTVENKTNLSVQIYSINDDGKTVIPLVEIRYNNNRTWGDADDVWGDVSHIWNANGLIAERRRFPHTTLRSNYKQIRITNSYTVVRNSDTLGLAYIDNFFKTAVLNNASSAWPLDSVDYYLSFGNDSYVTQYQVTARNSATQVTYIDTANKSPFANSKWQLSGYRKSEQIGIISYVLHYKMLTKSQKSYQKGSDFAGNQ